MSEISRLSADLDQLHDEKNKLDEEIDNNPDKPTKEAEKYMEELEDKIEKLEEYIADLGSQTDPKKLKEILSNYSLYDLLNLTLKIEKSDTPFNFIHIWRERVEEKKNDDELIKEARCLFSKLYDETENLNIRKTCWGWDII